ncbi:MAG: SH3 domain-containing protein [Clostridia bacterium]|nr:SH3 domain-containing protein [Clostridia bacterium]
MKVILSAILSAALVIGTAAQAAQYTITYYDAEGSLVNAKSLDRPSDMDISEYINHYVTSDTESIKVHKYDDGEWNIYDAEVNPAADNISYTEKAPNVTDEMCRADYWIKDGADNLILSTDEIKALNARIMAEKETMMYDLDSLPETYDGKAMAQSLAGFKSPEEIFLDGEPVEESYYEAIRTNILGADTTENEAVKYGICTTHTVLKAYPYEEWLSDSDWDKEWDNFVNTAVLVGEPIVLYNSTADGKFIYARCSCCEGWVSADDVAVCENKDEWIKAKTHENFLVVTGERVWLEPSYDADLSKKQLTMGTVLEMADGVDFTETNRLAWNNYAVKLPVRNSDGSYGEKTALISANRDVNVGYLPYTSANVVKQAFKSLGNRYGWGGMLNSQDCSSFAREVYMCFGFVLPRNTTWQAAMPVAATDISGMTDDEKKSVLDKTPAGAILIWPAHEMIYLGEKDGLYYTINDVSSLVSPANPEGGVIRPRSVIVNDLSILRGNGTTWLTNLTKVVVVK